MTTTITDHEQLSIARLDVPHCRIAKAYLTVDLHQENSTQDQATFELYGDLLLSGTATHNRVEFLDAINSLGAEVNISTTDGFLTIEFSSPQLVWKKLVALVTKLLTTPTFEKDEFKRVQRLTLNAIHDQKENTKRMAVEQLRNELYCPGDRHASCSLAQLEASVKAAKVTDVKAMHKRIGKQKWYLSVVSSIQSCEHIEQEIKRIAPKLLDITKSVNESKKPTARLLTTNVPSKDNIEFGIGCALPLTLLDKDFPALQFGIAVLAKWGGFAGRLMSTVREKEGLTYSIYGRAEGFYTGTHGYFRIGTFFNPPQAVQGITSTFREIKTLYKKGITAAEFVSFKTILETQTILRGDSPLRQLDVLHGYHKLDFTTADIERYESSLTAVSIEDVHQAITKYLNPKKMIISAAGPITAVKKELASFIKTV